MATASKIEDLYSSDEKTTLSAYESQLAEAVTLYTRAKDLSDQAQLQGASYGWSNQVKNDDYNAKIAVTNSWDAERNKRAKTLADYRAYLFTKYEQTYQAQNPEQTIQALEIKTNAQIMAQIAESKAKIEAEQLKAKADIEAKTATFASENKKAILYVSIGLVVVIVIGYVWLKFVKKKQP